MTDTIPTLMIASLLPLSSCLLVLQTNPYNALVMRGMLGAIAALLYATFGAADVALTEALVGTLLSVVLYAIAIRSALSNVPQPPTPQPPTPQSPTPQPPTQS